MSPELPQVHAIRRVVLYGDAFADRIPELGHQLGDEYEIVHVPYGTPARELEAAVAGALAMIAVRTEAGLPFGAGLRLLQVPGIGWDGVAPQHVPTGVQIATVGGHETAVAEYCVAQMLEWCHRLRPADADFRRGNWERSSRFGGAPHRELRGATVGIVGFGAIGQASARLLTPFDVRLLAANRSPISDATLLSGTYPLDKVPEMFTECDFAVVAIALTPETEGFVGRAALEALGPHGVIINVARGPVIDEQALWAALSSKRLGGAIVDVWYRYPDATGTSDPAPAHFDFAALPNVVMTPHIAGWSTGTASRRVVAIAENIRRAAAGEPVRNVVALGQRP